MKNKIGFIITAFLLMAGLAFAQTTNVQKGTGTNNLTGALNTGTQTITANDGGTITYAGTGTINAKTLQTYTPATLPVSTATQTALNAKADTSALPVSLTNQQFVFVGDSLTRGLTAPNTLTYPAALMLKPAFAGRGTPQPYGIDGATLSTIQADYAAGPYTKRPAAIGSSQSVLFLWIGANDYTYNGWDVNAWFASLESYMTTAKTDGFKIVLFTIMRRATSTFTGGNFAADIAVTESNRQAANRLIMSSSIPDIKVDVASLFTDPLDTTYFLDGTHLNDLGNHILADFVASQIIGQGSLAPVQQADVVLPYVPVISETKEAALTAAAMAFTAPLGVGTISPATPATGTTACTVEVWAKVDPLPIGETFYFLGGGANGLDFGYLSGTVSTLGGRMFSDGVAAQSQNVVFAGVWSHFVMTRDAGGVITYYYNGVAAGTSTASGDWSTGFTNMNSPSLKNGMVARPRYYNYALSAEEVAAKTQSLSTLDKSELIASQTAIASTAAAPRYRYRIASTGTSDFTGIGASANTVGVEFIATGSGTGTGTLIPLGAIWALEDGYRSEGTTILDRGYGASHCSFDGVNSFIRCPAPSPANKTYSGTVTAGTFTDGYVTWSSSQFNRPTQNIEFQYAGGSGSGVRIGGAGSHASTFDANTGVWTNTAANGTAPILVGSTTECPNLRSATTTALANARTINGVSFDGTANITVPVNFVAAPATASSTGTTGSVAYDSSYFYVCIATDTWKRAALSTW